MAKQYLDKDGLLYFWQKIKAIFAKKDEAIKNITRSGTTFTATRADGTSFTFTQQDNNTWNANAVGVAGYVAAPSSTTANKVWKTDGDGVPAWRDDANTTYSDATTSASGLMSSSDKTKLNGIATGAEVNQNAFSNVKVGSTTIAADGKTDTLELVAGTNVTLTPDDTNDKVTIATSAEVNQNAFSNVKVGSTTIAADGKTDTLELVAGSNVTLTPDATNDKVTIAATQSVTSVAGKTGAVTLDKSDVGLGNVDNTADANKNVASAAKLTTARSVDGVSFDGTARIHHYATCSSVTNSTTKVATIADNTFTLEVGAVVFVKFTYQNTASEPKLNVNNTGEKTIIRYGTSKPGITVKTAWYDGAIVGFVYDGTNWVIIGWQDNTDTTYTNAKLGQGYGDGDTLSGSTTTAKVNITNYVSTTGGIISVHFIIDPSSITSLNVNGYGAKTIRYNNTATSLNGLVNRYDTATFIYDGTYYHLIAVDKAIAGEANVIETVKVDGTALTPDSNKAVNIDLSGKVPTSRTVNGKALSSNITLSASDVSAIPTSAKGAASGVCPLNSSSKIDSTYLPSYVDDVIEAYARSGQTALSQNWLATGSASGTVITPETGKIYVLMADSGDYAANTQFRWSGTAYVKLADGGVSSITNAEIDTIVAA